MRQLLKKSGDELVQRIKDERYIATYLTDKDDANYFATVTIPWFFGKKTNNQYQLINEQEYDCNPLFAIYSYQSNKLL